MRCPACERSDARHTVSAKGPGSSTLMHSSPYWDEEGRYHHHDLNWHTQGYSCSNGHRWKVSTRSGCPTCNDRETKITEDEGDK